MFRYEIYIDPLNYVAVLNDSNAGIVWELDDNGVIFRKRLDGKFSFNRSGNEPLYDKLMSLTFCEECILTCYNDSGEVIQGSFRKKALTISEDKCLINLKFDRVDEYTCLDRIADKEFNILATYDGKPAMPIYTAKLLYRETLEYVSGSGYADLPLNYESGYWKSTGVIGDDNYLYPYPQPTFFPEGVADQGSWTFLSNTYTIQGAYVPGNNNFFIETVWVREVKTIQRIGEEQTETPPNAGTSCDFYQWNFATTRTINGILYDVFARQLEDSGVEEDFNTPFSPFTLTNVLNCNGAEYLFTRCRKLNDIITTIIYDCFPDGFESEFLKSTVNPISGKDLSNLMLSQKSDCIYSKDPDTSVYSEKTDPATKGIITFKNLMSYLQNEFQLYWAIDRDGKFRIEHKKYWRNNGSYTESNTVGVDLTAIYPYSLYGTNEYTFESDIPIREKFSFMEAWNIDFTGMPIDYSQCVNTGSELAYSVDLITTDIDPNFLFTLASNDGFCMFHCNRIPETDNTYMVIAEVGLLSGNEYKNTHLSWANLHDAYWKYDRYLPSGIMNGKETEFDVRPLKYQIPISFPYCVADFDPQRLIRTYLGDGAVKTAKFSFKTNWITVELQYIDTI